MKTIAVVDDDVFIGDMLEEVLTREGYRVRRAFSGTEAVMLLSAERPDLLLLDLMLPGLSGEEVLPKAAGVPVIILSAKSQMDGKVKLLMDGAADYLTKPFDTRELLARVAVQLRNAASAPSGECLSFGELKLDESGRQVLAGGQMIRLTRTEFAILKLLMRNPTQVITKSAMLDQLSLETPDCVESSLKVHVSNLRGKLRAATGNDYIEAVWGIGFKLRAPESFTLS